MARRHLKGLPDRAARSLHRACRQRLLHADGLRLPTRADLRQGFFRPRVEPLEERTPLALFMVTNTNDSGPGSLRQAMLDANDAPGADQIYFSIPGSGVRTIAPLSPPTDDHGTGHNRRHNAERLCGYAPNQH
jgi:hypothetical protein